MTASRRVGVDCEVLVVGGGVIGMAVALAVAAEGRRVTLLECGRPGAGASRAAAGMLAPQAEADGTGAMLRLGLASRALYPEWVDRLRRDSGVDPHLESEGTLEIALDEAGAARLERRAAWQLEAGLEARLVSAGEAVRLAPGLAHDLTAALFLPHDLRVDPVRLCSALAGSLAAASVEVRAGVRAEGFSLAGGRVAGVRAGGREWAAGTTVLAAGVGSEALAAVGLALPRVEPVRGQMVQLAPGQPAAGPTLAGAGGYLVPRRSGQVLAGSTTERVGHRPWPTTAGVQSLLAVAARLRPDLREARLVSAWAGLRPGSADGLPSIGAGAPGLILALGHYRNGILLAPVTGALVADMVAGRAATPDAEAFSPARPAAVAPLPAR